MGATGAARIELTSRVERGAKALQPQSLAHRLSDARGLAEWFHIERRQCGIHCANATTCEQGIQEAPRPPADARRVEHEYRHARGAGF